MIMGMEPSERGRGHHIDEQLNALFTTYQDAELAEIKGDTHQLRSLVADGLARSCALMRQLQDIDVLQSVTPSKEIRKLLGNKVQIERFVRIERELLQRTKLDQHVVEYLVKALQFLLASKKQLRISWRSDLELFIHLVCSEARTATTMLQPPSLLKRAVVAGGGGLIAMLNLVPIPGIPLPPEVVPISSTAGVWLIAEAAKDHLAAFFKK
jgi:hypothetical protein